MSLSLLIRAPIPSRGAHLHDLIKPNYLPKVPAPNTISLGVKASIEEFRGTHHGPKQLIDMMMTHF